MASCSSAGSLTTRQHFCQKHAESSVCVCVCVRFFCSQGYFYWACWADRGWFPESSCHTLWFYFISYVYVTFMACSILSCRWSIALLAEWRGNAEGCKQREFMERKQGLWGQRSTAPTFLMRCQGNKEMFCSQPTINVIPVFQWFTPTHLTASSLPRLTRQHVILLRIVTVV